MPSCFSMLCSFRFDGYFGDLLNDSFIKRLQFECMHFTWPPTVPWYFLLSCYQLEKPTSFSMKFEQGEGKEIKGREELQKGQMSQTLWFYFWLLEIHIPVCPRRGRITYIILRLSWLKESLEELSWWAR